MQLIRQAYNSLKRAGLTVTYQPEITTEKLVSSIANYDIIIVRSRTKLTKDIIDLATSAKIIVRVGVGLDNIDVVAAEGKKIRVINAPEARYQRCVRISDRLYDVS